MKLVVRAKRQKEKLVRKSTSTKPRESKIAPIPMRNSKHAEEQGVKVFLVVALSIALIVILALFLFYQDDAIAGQAFSISTLNTNNPKTPFYNQVIIFLI